MPLDASALWCADFAWALAVLDYKDRMGALHSSSQNKQQEWVLPGTLHGMSQYAYHTRVESYSLG